MQYAQVENTFALLQQPLTTEPPSISRVIATETYYNSGQKYVGNKENISSGSMKSGRLRRIREGNPRSWKKMRFSKLLRDTGTLNRIFQNGRNFVQNFFNIGEPFSWKCLTGFKGQRNSLR